MKKMKNFIFVLLVSTILMGVFVGCSKTTDPKPEAPSGNCNIIKFSFEPNYNKSYNQTLVYRAEGIIDHDAATINVTVDKGFDLTKQNLYPLIKLEDENASYEPKITEPINFKDPVKFTVTAVKGAKKTYTVIVENAAEDAKGIQRFRFMNGENQESYFSYFEDDDHTKLTVVVPHDFDVENATPTIALVGGTIKIKDTTDDPKGKTNFTSPVTYELEAANHEKVECTVTVKKALQAVGSGKNLIIFDYAEDTSKGKILEFETTAETVSFFGDFSITEDLENGFSKLAISNTAKQKDAEGNIVGVNVDKEYTISSENNVTVLNTKYDLTSIKDDIGLFNMSVDGPSGYLVETKEDFTLKPKVSNATKVEYKYLEGEKAIADFTSAGIDIATKVVKNATYTVYAHVTAPREAKRVKTITIDKFAPKPNKVNENTINIALFDQDNGKLVPIYSKDGAQRVARLTWTYDFTKENMNVDQFEVTVAHDNNNADIETMTVKKNANGKFEAELPLNPKKGSTDANAYSEWKNAYETWLKAKKAFEEDSNLEDGLNTAADNLNKTLEAEELGKIVLDITIKAKDSLRGVKFTSDGANKTETMGIPALPTALTKVIPEGYDPAGGDVNWTKSIYIDAKGITNGNIEYLSLKVPEKVIVSERVLEGEQVKITIKAEEIGKVKLTQGTALANTEITAKVAELAEIDSPFTQFKVDKNGILTGFYGTFEGTLISEMPTSSENSTVKLPAGTVLKKGRVLPKDYIIPTGTKLPEGFNFEGEGPSENPLTEEYTLTKNLTLAVDFTLPADVDLNKTFPKGAKYLELPNYISQIGNGFHVGFKDLSDITMFVVPEGVKKIQLKAFESCVGKVIKLPKTIGTNSSYNEAFSMTVATTGFAYPFAQCTIDTVVLLPSTTTWLNDFKSKAISWNSTFAENNKVTVQGYTTE